MTSHTKELTETLTLRGVIVNPFKQVSTNGGYLILKDEKVALSSVLSNLSEAMEKQSIPKNQTDMVLTYDVTNSKFALAAVVKR